MELPKLKITAKAEKSARAGHPWVYGEEITSMSAEPENGALCDVFSPKDKYLGTGFYNNRSAIAVRIVTRNRSDKVNVLFWERRVRYAIDYRRTVMPGEDFFCCRLIFGEADGFPGLTIDRFGDVLVAQVLSLGMEKRKREIFAAVVHTLREMGERVRLLYERSDGALREKEGLEPFVGFFEMEDLLTEDEGKVEIVENGIRYLVDYKDGQKTGFFLDQKYNRLAVARIAAGKTVLDCFTHTGAFALNAAKGGAKSVTAVDISAFALECAAENARRSGIEGVQFVCADVFDHLKALAERGGHPYDFIILDPPAFTKSRDTAKSAYRGYLEINRTAMQLLPRGGYLATCSCSHFMRDSYFKQMLNEAAADAGVQLRQIEGRQQAPDHPILWNVPETDYLKFYIFQVV